jgi:hypothetical protein
VAGVTAYLVDNRLVVMNVGPEKITLLNISSDIEGLVVFPSGFVADGVDLLPHERHQFLVNKDPSQGPHVDVGFGFEFVDDSGTKVQTVSLRI